jgi:ABC-2 type transport system permease protein
MSLAFFFMMIFMLMGGLFTPIDSMPHGQSGLPKLTGDLFHRCSADGDLKGSGFNDVKKSFINHDVDGGAFNGWAVLNYRKTT